MKTPLKTAVGMALSLASLLWLTSPASAHDGNRSYRNGHAWSDSYRGPRDDYSTEWRHGQRDDSSWRWGQYNKHCNKTGRFAYWKRHAQQNPYPYYQRDYRDSRYEDRFADLDHKDHHHHDRSERNGWNGR